MKYFRLVVWGVVALFVVLMGVVVIGSSCRPSNMCRLDPSQFKRMRMLHSHTKMPEA